MANVTDIPHDIIFDILPEDQALKLCRALQGCRVYIPKGDSGKTRPIGIPTFEDKVLQRAVTMVLEAVYEQDFLDCSYGFRPGRSAHQERWPRSEPATRAAAPGSSRLRECAGRAG